MSENTNSVKLTKTEYEAFIEWLSWGTKKEASDALQITRATLDRVISFKSGKKTTINKILKQIR